MSGRSIDGLVMTDNDASIFRCVDVEFDRCGATVESLPDCEQRGRRTLKGATLVGPRDDPAFNPRVTFHSGLLGTRFFSVYRSITKARNGTKPDISIKKK